MAEKISIDLILNNRGALTSLEDLRAAVKVALAEFEGLDPVNKNYESLKTFIASANTEIARQQKLIKGVTSEEIAGAYARIGGGISSTFAAASAALAAFGVENESVLGAAADAQNLLTIAISTRQIQEGILSARQLSNLVAERARLALTRLNTTATNVETGSEVANTASVEANTAANIKNSASTGVKTAATEAETVATVSQTGAQGLLNTITAAGTNVMKAFYTAVAANPFGAIIALIGVLVTSFIVLKNLLEDTDNVVKNFNKASDESISTIRAESIQVTGLVNVVQDLNRTQKDRQSAYEELQKILPGIKDLTLDQALAENKLTEAYNLQITVLKAKARLDAAQQIYSAAFTEVLKVQRSTLGDYAFTWQSLLTALTQGNWAFGALQAQFSDLSEVTQVLVQADELLNTEVRNYNEAIIAQNNFIEENTKGKKGNTSATNEQTIANNRLKDAYNQLTKFLQDTIKLYKELGKVVEVEDRIPELVENVNNAYKERNKLLKDGNNQFAQGLKNIGFEDKILDSRIEEFRRFADGLLDTNLLVTDNLKKLTDEFSKAIEANYKGFFENVGEQSDTFKAFIQSVRGEFIALFEAGKITPAALESIDALIQNVTNLNRLVTEGGVSLSEIFSPGDINAYLEAQRKVLIAEGKIAFAIDETTGQVIKARVSRQDYSQNLAKVQAFEEQIYNKTIAGLEDIRNASNENFKAAVIRAGNEKRITLEQQQTLLANADALSKSEIERTRIIEQIAQQRVESIKKQVDGTQKEIDRIRRYNYQFATERQRALENVGASITTLIEKETGDFLKGKNLEVRGQLTRNSKIREAERLLQAYRLDVTKFSEEEKLKIYEATFDYQKELNQKLREDAVKNFQDYIKILQQALNLYQEYLQSAEELALQRIEVAETELLRKLDQARANSLVNEAEYQKKRLQITEEYAAQRAAVEKKFRIRQMRLDQAQAVTNGALAVSRAFVEGGPIGFITAGLVAAATAAQVATIQQQIGLANSLKKGGMIKGQEGLIIQGPSHEYGGVMLQNGAYNLEGGEAVINRVSSRNYQGLLSQINQMGGGRPLVASFDDSRIVDAIAKQKMEPIRAYVIQQEITDAQNVSKRLEQLSRF